MNNTTPIKNYKLELSAAPHIHSKWSTKKAMWLVILSLVPVLISSIIFFGLKQLSIISVSVAFCLLTELTIKKLRKKEVTLDDGSAIITGLLLAFILPPNFSLFATAIGAIFSIGIAKELFGGLGFNIFNPALAGRAFLQAAYPVSITTWTKPNYDVDTITSATPLAAYKFDKISTDLSSLFWGNVSGSLGETSALAILIGGLFLIFIGVVNYRIPLAMILSLIFFSAIFWIIDPFKYQNPIFHLLAGGFLFGTFFMATDWVTSPITSKGMWIYGILISFLIVLIRNFGGLPEGVMYAILIMNSLVPAINRFTVPKIFGEKK
ncbi:MAG: RnfABCDGE type electron transport complex subunit D [Melioribacteraceae bacterium]|nr:RnfABCDGE type electron transport complex subunit D [Melioribacteraceae bacterium]